MKFLNPIIDKLQATFPPNRVAILLAGVITAVSGSIAAWTAAHFPGLDLGAAEIAGVLGAAVIITVRLLDRWFDRWQEGEQAAEQQAAVAELADSPEAQRLFEAFNTFGVLDRALTELRIRIINGSINEAEVASELDAVGEVVSDFLLDFPEPLVGEEPEASEGIAPTPPAE